MSDPGTEALTATIDYLSALAVFFHAHIPAEMRDSEAFLQADGALLDRFRLRTAHIPLHEPEALGSAGTRAYVQHLIRMARDTAPVAETDDVLTARHSD
ncbi:hypothetical protein J8J14_11120 [Roseomonas sp. SSH11]|uniref:Uncharacterized protein n=2 Tax=Pararoseomonas baculiformis TaxID=2820812 RepID=A0ABS4AFN3_9PROT|nr:hypothetical protein [Pararoseomonas baculiformis]